MAKNLIQDMVKIKRASKRAQPSSQMPQKEEVVFKSAPVVRNQESKPRYKLWVVAVASVIFLFFSLSYLFLSATVKVNPKTQDIVLNENMSASLGASGEVLSFDSIVISGEESKMVQAVGEEDVLEKAKGTVIIYNNFSSAPQKLSIDTRLVGSNDKIYKTDKALTVPGMKGNTPGSVEVGIHATEAGEGYNSGPLDFTIFGFKGTPKYSKFYARSKDEISGGFKGKASVISDIEKSSTISELKTALQEKLFKKAIDQIPDGFILFKDAVFLDINENNNVEPVSSVKDNMLPVKISGTLYGFLFDEDKLTNKIAENKIPGYENNLVYIPNVQDLTFSLISKDVASYEDVKSINFILKGTAKIVWRVDENKLIADLLDKSKKDFNQILLQYPNIESANSTISPFWKRSFPDESKDIKMIVNYPK